MLSPALSSQEKCARRRDHQRGSSMVQLVVVIGIFGLFVGLTMMGVEQILYKEFRDGAAHTSRTSLKNSPGGRGGGVPGGSGSAGGTAAQGGSGGQAGTGAQAGQGGASGTNGVPGTGGTAGSILSSIFDFLKAGVTGNSGGTTSGTVATVVVPMIPGIGQVIGFGQAAKAGFDWVTGNGSGKDFALAVAGIIPGGKIIDKGGDVIAGFKKLGKSAPPVSKKAPDLPSGEIKPATPVGGRIPPPQTPAAFPELARAKPKTPVQGGGGLRKRWVDRKGNIYEWDSQHGTLEKYNKRGKHLGEFDPNTGMQTKPANPGRSIEA